MFKRWFKRLSVDDAQLRAESIRAWAQTVDGAVSIAETPFREVVRVAGVVENIRVRPREGAAAFEAEMSDGTGTVTAVWLGRRTIQGVSLGSRLVIQGRLGGTPGHRQMMNPSFEFSARDDAEH